MRSTTTTNPRYAPGAAPAPRASGRIAVGLLAAANGPSRWESMSRNFRASDSGIAELLIFLAVIAGLAVVLWGIFRATVPRAQRRPCNSPLRLFLELCHAHGLKWSERWLLWRLARARGMAHPAQLFLGHAPWRSKSLPPALRIHAAQLARLETRLLAELSEETTESPPTLLAFPATAAAPATVDDPAPPRAVRRTPLRPAAVKPALDIPPWPAPDGAEP